MVNKIKKIFKKISMNLINKRIKKIKNRDNKISKKMINN
jgi:hypothetical protein